MAGWDANGLANWGGMLRQLARPQIKIIEITSLLTLSVTG